MPCKQCKKQEKSIKIPISNVRKENNNLKFIRNKRHFPPRFTPKGVNNVQKQGGITNKNSFYPFLLYTIGPRTQSYDVTFATKQYRSVHSKPTYLNK
jgi:hypothetical protein